MVTEVGLLPAEGAKEALCRFTEEQASGDMTQIWNAGKQEK